MSRGGESKERECRPLMSLFVLARLCTFATSTDIASSLKLLAAGNRARSQILALAMRYRQSKK